MALRNFFERPASRAGFNVSACASPHVEQFGGSELLISQFQGLKRQMPMLYAILVINTLGLSITYFGKAPPLLTLWIPSVLGAVCAIRLLWWRYAARESYPSVKIASHLRQTTALSAVLSVVFCWWAFQLYPYADGLGQAHIFFFLAVTASGCVFALMHLRAAALIVGVGIAVACVVFFGASGNLSLVAMSVNFAVVMVLMILIQLGYYRDFINLVQSRKAILCQQEATQRLSEENFRLAHLDVTTGLPNRRSFLLSLAAALKHSKLDGKRGAFGILDLDGFKRVNDVHGQAMGDKLLAEVGLRLEGARDHRQQVVHLGADEFGVLFSGDPTDAEILNASEALCAAVRMPYQIDTYNGWISATMGVVTFPDQAHRSREVIERAEYAVSYAKDHRRGTTVLFSSEHERGLRRDADLRQALLSSDFDSEMSVAFQPIVSLDSMTIVGFEALARWQNASLGRVSPADFIPAAERLGVINQLTSVLLRKAIAEAQTWPSQYRLAFNLSANDIVSPNTISDVLTTIRGSGIDSARLDLEITETAAMQDFAITRGAMHALKDAGAKISLDDFGTGYSSLSHLLGLPIDKLKIDKSFVTGLGSDPVSRKIVKSVLGLTTDLGISCVVEGVETADQLAVLRQLRCPLVQGYIFHPPLSADQLPAIFAQQSSAIASRLHRTV